MLHLDDEVVAIDKPAGLASIPERDLPLPSARSWLEAELGQAVWVVHRLDKDASGLMLFARTAEVHRELNLRFEHRQVHKTYQALLVGVVADENGLIELPLRQFGSGRVAVDTRRGKPAVTGYKVLERLPAHTLVQASPETGRRHQLRAHFFSLGHPIAGDGRYGEAAPQASYPRLLLHAQALALGRDSGVKLQLRCAVPEVFEQVLQGLRDSAPDPAL
ncbi:MAG: RNA pseudouridine synthase [Pseudomonadota bacterium]